MKRYIYVTTQRVGFHSYPNSPEEVSFLRNKHRHLFKIKLTIEVYEGNREIEFFMLLNKLNLVLDNISFNQSCENIAYDIVKNMKDEYDRYMECEVSEDGENGGIIKW